MKLKYWAYLVSGLVAFSFPVSMATLILIGFALVVFANLGFFIVGSIASVAFFGIVQQIVGEEQ